jgi:hypothetical protein
MALDIVLKNRHNKTAKGFSIHEEQRKLKGRIRISNPKHPNYNPTKYKTLLKLMVKGTTDVLAGGYTFMVKKIKKEHPIDKGYFKECYILSDFGKMKLKRLKREKLEENI